jgi:cellulose synthase/poly-beta-1,6-N-acetylglucosamine synthase-like glycosyltransferase
VTLVIALILAPLTAVTLYLAIEILVGLTPLSRASAQPFALPRAAIIVPAHDEEMILKESLQTLIQVSADVPSLVVADNCTDGTAYIARQAGVSVIERTDNSRRGKGFALAFAREHLRAKHPAVVLIIDADCSPEPGSVERLIAACAKTSRPCQAVYLQRPVVGPPTLQISTFAFFIKNVVRQRGLQRLAARANLLGTGMAFPWTLFEMADLATAHIVEDLEIGLNLAGSGHPPIMIEDAAVWTDAASLANTVDQRSRWEGGYLQSAAKACPSLFMRSLSTASVRELCAALSLLVPPLALLVVLDLTAIAIAALAWLLLDASPWPPLLLGTSLVAVGVAIALAWKATGSRFISLSRLLQIPRYLIWKLPIYLGLARSGAPDEWLRTGRR